jgi:hypothetical protein
MASMLAVGEPASADQTKHVFVRDGQPRAVIVSTADVPPLARFAAGELQAYVKRSTGAVGTVKTPRKIAR